jgi:hypothetical protein
MNNTVILKTDNYTRPLEHITDAVEWCNRQFGKNGYQLSTGWPDGSWTFQFAQPTQATHFTIKWT